MGVGLAFWSTQWEELAHRTPAMVQGLTARAQLEYAYDLGSSGTLYTVLKACRTLQPTAKHCLKSVSTQKPRAVLRPVLFFTWDAS